MHLAAHYVVESTKASFTASASTAGCERFPVDVVRPDYLKLGNKTVELARECNVKSKEKLPYVRYSLAPNY